MDLKPPLFPLYVALFFILPDLVVGYIGDATGRNFYHNFGSFDKSLWKISNDRISCIASQCFRTTSNALEWHSIEDDIPPQTYMSLTLTNNCDGQKCCWNHQHHSHFGSMSCTQYTGGQLSSVHFYGYGSFRFLALADGVTLDDKYLSGRYCFNLEGRDSKNEVTRISMCTVATQQFALTLIYQHAGHVKVHEVELAQNVGKTLGIYRIDWRPDAIHFYVKGQLVGFLNKQSHGYIPNQPLRITICIIPDDMELPLSNSTDIVSVNLHVYRARYIRWDYEKTTPPSKTDLFVDKTFKESIDFILVFCATGILILCCSVLGCLWRLREDGSRKDSTIQKELKKERYLAEGHYVLIG